MILLSSLLHLVTATILSGVYHCMIAHASPLEERQSSLPTGWVPFGCYSDTPASRTLKVASFTDVTGMTIEECIAFCAPSGFLFSGVEFSRECYCDNVIESPGAPIDSSNCNMPCTGNAGETCGGAGAINIFQNTLGPKIKQTAGTYQYVGCYQDGVNGAPRSLQHQVSVTGGMTAEKCTAACKAAGFVLAGLEFAQECWCDSYFPTPVLVPDTDCNLACTGDNTELCGAGNRLAIYQDTSVPALRSGTCLTCAQLRIIDDIPEFNFTAQPLSSAAVPIATPTSLAPFQLGVERVPGQPTEQEFTVFKGGTQSLHAFVMGCGFPPIDGWAMESVRQVDSQLSNGFTNFAPAAGTPLQLNEVGQNGPAGQDQQYCAAVNTVTSKSTFIGPPLLAKDNFINQWGFCPLTTFPDGNDHVVTWAFEDASVLCIPILIEMTLF